MGLQREGLAHGLCAARHHHRLRRHLRRLLQAALDGTGRRRRRCSARTPSAARIRRSPARSPASRRCRSSPTSSCLAPSRRAASSAMRQLRAAGVNQPLLGSESWDGDYWLEGVPNLSDFYFVTYGSVFGNDTASGRRGLHGQVPGEVRQAARHLARHHRLQRDRGLEHGRREGRYIRHRQGARCAARASTTSRCWPGRRPSPTDQHINMQRDLLLIEVKDGKSGNVIGSSRGEDAAIISGIAALRIGLVAHDRTALRRRTRRRRP